MKADKESRGIMLETYEATVQGDHIEWGQSRPPQVEANRKIKVSVTVLEKAQPTPPGESLFAILNRLAATDVYKLFGDPLEWQREQREDRPLLGRD